MISFLFLVLFASGTECWEQLDANQSFQVDRYSFSGKSTDTILWTGQELVVQLPVHFRLESFVSPSHLDLLPQVESIMTRTLRLVEEYYREQGIPLEIIDTYDTSQSYMPDAIPEKAHLVYLRPFRGTTMSTLRWGVNVPWEDRLRAQIYAHELSHLFGLLDEYDRPTLQAGFIGEEDSLLRNWDHPQGRFYPRHLEHILSIICPGDEDAP